MLEGTSRRDIAAAAAFNRVSDVTCDDATRRVFRNQAATDTVVANRIATRWLTRPPPRRF